MISRMISPSPPPDGRQWTSQCARCGSSLDLDWCEQCGGDGWDGHDCSHDPCCCLYPEDNVVCDLCNGEGSWLTCVSSPEWCDSHPLPDRTGIKRDQVEWFTFDPEATTK